MNYFLFEDDALELNLVFQQAELKRFVEYWEEGLLLTEIANKMRRTNSEIALLIFDHAERNIISPRKEGGF